MTPARLHALHEIDQRDLPRWPADTLPRLRPVRLNDPRDIDLSERIVVGVIKRLLSLHHAIESLSGRPLSRIDVAAQKILAIAIEQLWSFDRLPAHAIVDDAVEQTKRVGPRGAAGFVNAILRRAAASRQWPSPPEEAGSVGQRIERTFSVPITLYERFASLYGETQAISLSERLNAEPPTLARLIGDAKLDDIVAAGIHATPHESLGMVVLHDVRRDDLRLLAQANLAQVQDATSAATIGDLDLRPGQRVLDRCCGRGTKTRQILERLSGIGQVVAMDSSRERLASLRQSHAAAISAGHLMVIEGEQMEAAGANCPPFDRVLIDAPCSNSGVLGRRPEARYRQTPRDIREVAELQWAILRDTAPAVAIGGLLTYATCSIWPEENEALVRRLLRAQPGYELVSERTIAPEIGPTAQHYHDGGYAATLRRSS